MSGLTFEAEAGLIEAPLSAVGGKVSQAAETTLATAGKASYRFTISAAGDYVVKAMLNAPSEASNSFFFSIDQEPTDPSAIWDVVSLTSGVQERVASWRGNGTYASPQFSPKVFSLGAGVHTLFIRGREGGAALDSILVAPQSSSIPPAMPGNLRLITP